LGSIADNLTAIEHHVYKNKSISMETLLKALGKNFNGHEELRHQLVYNTPKYGNDNDEVDKFSVKIFDLFYEAVNEKPTYKGGVFRINLLPTTSPVYFGSVIGAMPDGRLKGKPLSEGISPVQGMDIKGPTAVIKSASKIDQVKTGGTLLNQKFSPSFFDSEEGIQKFTALIKSYFRLGGHHIQFNVVTANTLKKAQKHPEKYRDLIVRVAGYSDYFNDLGEDLQNEIISRTAHGEME
jgi:formate C-acetyltransferase